jgi:hypothetical protein
MGFDMDNGSGAASRIDLFKDLKEEGTVFETPELMRLYGHGSEPVDLIHQRFLITVDG